MNEFVIFSESFTPTVELNNLASQRKLDILYKSVHVPQTFFTSLTIGQIEVFGEGSTLKLARQDAAGTALKVRILCVIHTCLLLYIKYFVSVY